MNWPWVSMVGRVVYSIALQSWEQPCLSVLVFLVYVFICFRSMNEDLSACWTWFYLEDFPVRRIFCELFWVENLEFVLYVISAAVYLPSSVHWQPDLLLYVHEMLLVFLFNVFFFLHFLIWFLLTTLVLFSCMFSH